MKNSDAWTPDKRIEAWKEIVSAILGVIIVLATLYMAFMTFSSDTQNFTNAKDVLSLVYGLTGVVLGYYFGRIPADAQAHAATARAENMGAKMAAAAQALENIEKDMETMALTTRAIGGDEREMKTMMEQMRDIREGLRYARNMLQRYRDDDISVVTGRAQDAEAGDAKISVATDAKAPNTG